jgi:hypothetical protein
MAVFRNTVEGVWSPDPLASQSDEICDLMYAAHSRWLKRLDGHPLELIRRELVRKNLACYCAFSDACHADIYLEILAAEAAAP